ncbi:MAG: hypothetical protein ACHQIM_00270 [Sphingobacteriales bacterium]
MENSKYTKFGRDLQAGIGLSNHLFTADTSGDISARGTSIKGDHKDSRGDHKISKGDHNVSKGDHKGSPLPIVRIYR